MYHTMLMRWFRRNVDLSLAKARPTTEDDIKRVTRLLRDGARRYYGFSGNVVPTLITNGHGIILEIDKEIWGTVIVSSFVHQTTWIRAVALARGIDIAEGMQSLLTSLHRHVSSQGVKNIFYAGDESSDEWFIPLLYQNNYVHDTEVVVYEKRNMDMPARGNQHVTIRKALAKDIETIAYLDRACFEVHWMKEDGVLETAMDQEAFFIVAEEDNHIAGYAYVTIHFGGHLLHLVRIAVDPQKQGQAIGIRLLSEVVAFARCQESKAITLNTQSYNEQAKRLYHWFGFQFTGEQQPVIRYDLDG